MKGRVFYGIAVAVSDRAVAVQDRAEIPHLKDGLAAGFPCGSACPPGGAPEGAACFCPMRPRIPDGCRCACRTGGRTKGARPPGVPARAQVRAGRVPEFRKDQWRAGAMLPWWERGGRCSGWYLFFYDSKTWRLLSFPLQINRADAADATSALFIYYKPAIQNRQETTRMIPTKIIQITENGAVS